MVALHPALVLSCIVSFWGFFGHRKINNNACFAVPSPLFSFYKANAEWLSEHAVDPDKRRYSTKGEAENHYIDIDHYTHNVQFMRDSFPRRWDDAIAKYSEDTLRAYGIGPYNAIKQYHRLVKAFQEKDKKKVLRISAELGHYIGDLHVPLHTTENYNGQLTGQNGIHGFWESRLPELFYEEYFMIFEPVSYCENPSDLIWNTVFESHSFLPMVLGKEKEIAQSLEGETKTNEERGAAVVETYSVKFARAYHESMQGMVEKRMYKATQAVASLWYTAWVDAGQPNPDKIK